MSVTDKADNEKIRETEGGFSMRLKKCRVLTGIAATVLLLGSAAYLHRHNQRVPEYSVPVRSDVTEIGLALREETDGLYVVGVRDHSAASACGFAAGDLLTHCGMEDLDSMQELENCLRLAAGEPLQLTVMRRGEQIRLLLPMS